MSEGTDGASPPDNLDALGSYIPPSSSLLDGSDRSGNNKETTDLLSGVQPAPMADSSTVDGAPATPFSIDDDDDEDDDVPPHHTITVDAPKLDTSNRSSSSSKEGSKSKSSKKKKQDGRPMSPLTPGDNNDDASSVHSSSSRKSQSNKGAKGAKLTKLSAKTTKIMSDYQAYLAEIETEFPTSTAADNNYNSDDNNSAASNSLKSARENVRSVYEAAEEGHHSYNTSASLRAAMDRESNSSIGSNNNGGGGGGLSIAGLNMEPLARAWDYSKSTIVTGIGSMSVAGAGGSSDAVVSSMNINARNMTNGDNDDIDDGITDITDYESQMLSRGQKYTHPWFHSRRVKRGLCMLVSVCALIGVSVGITKNNKNNKMDQLEDEMNASSSSSGGSGEYDGTSKSPPLNWGDYTEKPYESAALKYKPLDFNRQHGWLGQTYTEALIFCGHKSGYALCPYDAICPNGQDKEPLGGYKDGELADEDGWSWIPVSDSPNEWIQVRFYSNLSFKDYPFVCFLDL